MSQDKKYREFWLQWIEAGPLEPYWDVQQHQPHSVAKMRYTHAIEIAALDELKAEVERLRDTPIGHSEMMVAVNEAKFLMAAKERDELTAALRDMVGALEKSVNMPGRVEVIYDPPAKAGTTYFDCVDLARSVLTKHADLIGKLNPRKLGSE